MGFIDLQNSPELNLAEGIRARVITTACITVAHVELSAGAVLPEHSHFHEQVVNVTRGELELTVAGQKHVLTPGRAMILEPNITHSGLALTDVQVIDVFHPVREDFRGAKFDGYIQQ